MPIYKYLHKAVNKFGVYICVNILLRRFYSYRKKNTITYMSVVDVVVEVYAHTGFTETKM